MASTAPAEPRFVADVMCGRLARWLRLLGYDVLYRRDWRDDEIARAAAREHRLVLTRDRALTERRLVERFVLVADADLGTQLRQVAAACDLDTGPERLHRRCPSCNAVLAPCSAEAVAGRVPPFVQRTSRTFALCPTCDRVYWQGTQGDRARTRLEELVRPSS